MLSIEPSSLDIKTRHGFLLGGIAPRPIALVSTISEEGINNLSPFSFFNAFGANPPAIAFSPARRGRDNTTKDTYSNLVANKECVIQAVTYSMVEQVNLASCEYHSEIDEFVKSGLTPIKSDLVKPHRVKESPFQMECKLIEMIELGGQAGSGNLAICEVVKYHISEDILSNGMIDTEKIDLVGRMGANYYVRCFGNALFEVAKPNIQKGMGFDKLPKFLKKSNILTANDLGKLALSENSPPIPEVEKRFRELHLFDADKSIFERQLHLKDVKILESIIISLHKKGLANTEDFEKVIQVALSKNEIVKAWDLVVFCETYYHS